ncbi:TIGR03086 family metal-binding protein [Streptomyces sp. NPDC014734]|uniref:TIGR03086 family metal-binding protein n=1 Tax=Streptomyces sp. NPDC014734 TaxID=3364886 RepID=UPI0036FF5D69
METTPTVDLEPAARRIVGLLGGVDEPRLDGPTPCPDFTVRDLLAHLTVLSRGFRDAARKESGPTTGVAPDDAPPALDDDWRAVLPSLLDELVAAWRDPAARQGTTRVGGVVLPAREAHVVALEELLVHGWDLARSTGQDYAPDEAGLRTALNWLTPGDAPRPEHIFARPVPVPDDAPLLDRTVAMSGRRPDWRPER